MLSKHGDNNIRVYDNSDKSKLKHVPTVLLTCYCLYEKKIGFQINASLKQTLLPK